MAKKYKKTDKYIEKMHNSIEEYESISTYNVCNNSKKNKNQ